MAAAGKPGKARAVGSRVTGAGTKTVVSTAEEAAHIIGYLQTKAIPPHLQGTDVRTKRFKFIAKAELFTVFAGVDGVARLSIKRPDGRSLPVVYMSEHDRARAIAQEAHVATGHGDRHKTHTMVSHQPAQRAPRALLPFSPRPCPRRTPSSLDMGGSAVRVRPDRCALARSSVLSLLSPELAWLRQR